jgi:hypothetical protein
MTADENAAIFTRVMEEGFGKGNLVTRHWRAMVLSELGLVLGLVLMVGSPAGRPGGAEALVGADTPLYGVTVDGIGHLSGLVSSLAMLPVRPTTRVVFDLGEQASYYARAVKQIDTVSAVMGELLDSTDEESISTRAFQARVASYVRTLGSAVAIWEVGNEVNGNWTGPYPVVSAKLTEAYNAVHAAGAASALTLFANNFGPDNCGDGPAELTPLQFARRYVPRAVANGLDYVFLAYYPTSCGNREPSSRQVASYLQRLHAVFPHAALGFGEVGLPHPVTPSSINQAKQIMGWAYSLKPRLAYYVGVISGGTEPRMLCTTELFSARRCKPRSPRSPERSTTPRVDSDWASRRPLASLVLSHVSATPRPVAKASVVSVTSVTSSWVEGWKSSQ